MYMANYVLQVPTIEFVFTPYAMSKSSSHFYEMAKLYCADGSEFLPRLHLFGMSIEVGLKAAILVDACTAKARRYIQYELGHDLLKVRRYFENLYDAQLFNDEDGVTLDAINQPYRERAFQFFTPPMLESVLSGYKDLPDIANVRKLAEKVQSYLVAHKHFIGGVPLTEGEGRNANWPRLT